MNANYMLAGNRQDGTTVPSQGGRIAYIDLAKGLCIIFVIIGHINYLLYPELLRNPLSNASSSFRMPLYFFLSGIFFKTYGGFLDFTLHKTNRLLVPFVFWHLTLSLGLAWVIGIVTKGSWSLEPVKENFLAILHNGFPLNLPLWFLLALFVANILFYCLFTLAEKLKSIPLTATLAVETILRGVAGQMLRTFEVHLPPLSGYGLYGYAFFRGRLSDTRAHQSAIYPNELERGRSDCLRAGYDGNRVHYERLLH